MQELTARVGRETQRHGRRRNDGQSFALTRAMNAVPKPALASRFAMKAQADNKFSRKRSRRLGGSPAAHGSTGAAELRQLCQKQLLYPPTRRGAWQIRRDINQRTIPTASLCRGAFYGGVRMNQTFTKNEKATRSRRTMDATSTYKFEQAKREYIVEPIFKSEGEISLFSLLLNLMRLDAMG